MLFNVDERIYCDLNQIGKEKGFENLYIYLSNECNFYCKHCYLGDRLIKKERMELDQVKDYLKFWRDMGSKKLCFIGGEPTLYPYLKESIEYAKELEFEKIIIGSNGSSHACDELIKFSPDDISYIQISLDGASEKINDYIRRPGAYIQAVNTIQNLVKAGFDTRIIMTVNQYNSSEVFDMIELAENLKVTLVKFHIMSKIGNAHHSDLDAINPKEWLNICDRINELAKKKNNREMMISFQPTYSEKDNDNVRTHGYIGCVGKKLERISVFPDGKCYVCSYLFDHGIYYAKIKDNKIIKCNDSEHEMYYKTKCDSCTNKCNYDGCIAEDINCDMDFCSLNQDIFPVCRLWKIEL